MERRLRFHPAAQILAWCLLVAALQVMMPSALLTVTGLVLVGAFALSRSKFIILVRRTRWIMLSLLVIYAYSTPGVPLADALGMASPSLEGLSDGVLQLARLLAALASLALLLERLQRQQLIAGLYALSAPLKWLGLSRERIAVRLALTLHYAEVVVLRESYDWREALHSLFGLPSTSITEKRQSGAAWEPALTAGIADCEVELPIGRFTAADMLLLGSAMFILWLALE